MDEDTQLFNSDLDSFQALKDARLIAQRYGRNILVELGADWCVWCHRLEKFIASHTELYLLRQQNYVHVRVYSGDGETLSEICRHLPSFDGIPHYFVFSPDGQLLHSQDTDSLEDGESYDYDKVWEFLSLWGYNGNRGVLQ